MATTSGKKVVCTFLVWYAAMQGKKRAEIMFGAGKGLHRSWSH